MPIDRDTVRAVADLARLELPPGELERFEKQLGAILDTIAQLRELDVTSVEPMAHAGDFADVFRSDEPRPSIPTDEALANAPSRVGPYFDVPRILE